MRVLVTSSRLPHALELIRKLGRGGHVVSASDTFALAPGNHSRYAAQRFITASPTYNAPRFLDDISSILTRHPTDRLVPAFEEVFYLARHRARFEGLTELFFPGFELLRSLHDKAAFLGLARDFSIATHPYVLAKSRAELTEAARTFPQFFARPAYSRAGVTLYTNAGPLAGAVALEACEPTPGNPYVVQPYVTGTDICTTSIVHHGHVAAHAAYVHPLMLEHAGGIVFETVEVPETLAITQTIAEATGYHGMISLDFMQTDAGLVLIECNPRPNAGLAVMPDALFATAFATRAPTAVLTAPVGRRRKISFALLRNVLVHPSEAPQNLAALLHAGPDLFADPHDMLPFIYQILAYTHVIGYRAKEPHPKRSALMQGYLHDILWNGEPLG